MPLLSLVHFQLLAWQAPFFFIVSMSAMKISEPQGSQLEGRKEEGSTVHIFNTRRRDYQIKLVHISLRQAKYSFLQQSCSSDVELCHGVPQMLEVYMSSKEKSKMPQSKQTTERKSHIGQLWTEGPFVAPKSPSYKAQ